MKITIHVLHKQHPRKVRFFFLVLFSAFVCLTKAAPNDAPEMVANAFHAGSVKKAVFSSDGRWFATASADHYAKFYTTGQPIEKVAQKLANLPHDNGVNGAFFSPDNSLLVTVSNDNSAKIWVANHP
ncbi:WD40 repeat domain-containing protein [Endozoicomonas sp. ISHI1]|nr:hypothetical protein [Endozoicomonas sp. ISHI1]